MRLKSDSVFSTVIGTYAVPGIRFMEAVTEVLLMLLGEMVMQVEVAPVDQV